MRMFLVSLTVAGILVSSLALGIHYSPYEEPVSSRSDWNSGLVNHSAYSSVHGVPVALLGIAGFMLIGLLVYYEHRLPAAICSLLGLGYGLYLTNIEVHVLNTWCVSGVVSLILITVIAFLSFGYLLSHDTEQAVRAGEDSGGGQRAG